MAEKVTFNGREKLIIINNGETTINVQEHLYSAWKRWIKLTGTYINAQWPQAMRSVGGDPLPGSKQLGDTYFLMNGWKIRSWEGNHTLTINGNLYTEDGSSPLVPTLGSYNVIIINSVSSLVDSTVQQLPEIEYSTFNGGVTMDVINGTDGTAYPIGTPPSPCKSIPNALAINAIRGFDTLYVIGDCTLNSVELPYYLNGVLRGQGIKSSTITLDGSVFESAKTYDAVVTGTYGNDSSVEYYSCELRDLHNITVDAHDCILTGTIELNNSIPSNFYHCTDGESGEDAVIIEVNDCEALNFWDYSGGLKLTNIITPDTTVTVNLAGGTLYVDSTSTEGSIIVRGIGKLVGTTGGTTIDSDQLLNDETIASSVWDEDVGNHLIPESMGHEMYHAAYGDIVHLNVVSGVPGTTFPTGTAHQPCDNLTDALTIAGIHFMSTIHVEGALTIDGEDLTGITIAADRSLGNLVTITSMVNTDACYFENITVSGALSGATRFTTCVLLSLTGFDGGAKDCLLAGDVTITGTGANYFTNCDTYITDTTYKTITLGSNLLNIIRCRGSWEIAEYTGTAALALDFVASNVSIASSCVSGMIVVSGLTSLTDNSSAGCIVIDGTITERGITDKVWGELTADITVTDSIGMLLKALSDGAISDTDIQQLLTNQGIINTGVQKASKLIPHDTDLA